MMKLSGNETQARPPTCVIIHRTNAGARLAILKLYVVSATRVTRTQRAPAGTSQSAKLQRLRCDQPREQESMDNPAFMHGRSTSLHMR